jgi:hypothetical protein
MRPLFLLYFIFLFSVNLLISQPNSVYENKVYYTALDSFLIEENRNIYNGLEYFDIYRCLDTDNNKFYEDYDFFNGTVIYAGEPFFNLKLKYNLLDDLVILEFVNKKVNYLQLNSSLVESFFIGDSKFVRLPIKASIESFYGNGFFKEIHNEKSEYRLYVKYKKEKHKVIKDSRLFYKFSEKLTYVLRYKNNYFKINSKKDLLKALPNRKKEIQIFYVKNTRLYKLNKEAFYKKLFNQLNKYNS